MGGWFWAQLSLVRSDERYARRVECPLGDAAEHENDVEVTMPKQDAGKRKRMTAGADVAQRGAQRIEEQASNMADMTSRVAQDASQRAGENLELMKRLAATMGVRRAGGRVGSDGRCGAFVCSSIAGSRSHLHEGPSAQSDPTASYGERRSALRFLSAAPNAWYAHYTVSAANPSDRTFATHRSSVCG
jgi:hypothetical protein